MGNRYAVLAAEEEAGEAADELGPQQSGEESEADDSTGAQDFEEAEAAAKIDELLRIHLASCPAFGGSVREAACSEIGARIGWLTALASEHRSPIWKAAVARERALCEDALLHMCGRWR